MQLCQRNKQNVYEAIWLTKIKSNHQGKIIKYFHDELRF